MTTLDDTILPTVLSVIASVGIPATFAETTKDYKPATGAVRELTNTSRSATVSPPQRFKDQFVNGDTIQSADCYVYLAGSGLPFTPVKSMRVTVLAVTYSIVEINPLYSGESIAAYKIHLRK